MSFEESLKRGDFGEHAIWNYLIKMPNVRSIVDVRDDENFRQMDVDFLIENTKRQFTWVEVKTDYKAHETGNLCYEFSTSGHTGCFEKTMAEVMIYYLPVTETAHFVKMKDLRAYIGRVRPPTIRMGDKAEGFLVSIEELKRQKIIYFTAKGVI